MWTEATAVNLKQIFLISNAGEGQLREKNDWQQARNYNGLENLQLYQQFGDTELSPKITHLLMIAWM